MGDIHVTGRLAPVSTTRPVPQFAGACRNDRLDDGETATMTVVQAVVTLDVALGTRVTNRAFVAESSAPDPEPGNTRQQPRFNSSPIVPDDPRRPSCGGHPVSVRDTTVHIAKEHAS